jgi:RPA family protein
MVTARKREVAWRVFATELNSAMHSQSGNEAYDPNYIITELGAKINRIFVAGVFTEKENMGTEDDPLWRARVVDPTGVFFISAGRFQPESAKKLGELEPPQTLALVGKIRTFTSDDGRLFVSIRPETIKSIDITTRNLWILDASKSLLRRLELLNEALKMDPIDEKNLFALGFNKLEVAGVSTALNLYNYNQVDLSRYEQQAREILMNLKDGIYDLEIMPQEFTEGTFDDSLSQDEGPMTETQIADLEAKENIIKDLVEELGHEADIGAIYQKVMEAAESKGLSRDETEECVNILMHKGVIFEPSLGYLKSVEK